MATLMRGIHSVMRKSNHIVREAFYGYARWKYSRSASEGEPIPFDLAEGLTIRLLPWGQIAELLYVRDFERAERDLTIAYLKEGMNVVDVGANVGLYSILAAKLIGTSGRVWSFEPSSETHACLLRNLSLNGVESVIPNRLALADVGRSRLALCRDAGYRDGDRYLSRAQDRMEGGQRDSEGGAYSEIVDVMNLDSYADENCGNARIDFIKMDIEGGEFSALRGAREVLCANPDVLLLVECTREGCARAGHTQADVFDFLRGLGFGLYGWNRQRRNWRSDEDLLVRAGNIWACRGRSRLPCPPSQR